MARMSSEMSHEGVPKPDIPDYELLRCIGRGSYGDVWLARGMAQTFRAIKIVYRDRFDDARPFERELAGIRKFDPVSRANDGFVDVLHVGQTEAYFYYVMELADDAISGEAISPDTYSPKTLSQVLAQRSRLPFEESLEIGITLSKALSYLHQRELVHRDIKPSNIIFVHGLPKLADIGLVADMKDPKSFVGTEGFIPPEGPGTARSDIFSLGKVLYEVSMGEDRHNFPTLPKDIDQWANADQLREINEVLLKACQNDPQRRYQSADEMYRDLAGLVNGKSIRRLRLLERRWLQFKKVALVSGALVGITLILGYEYIRESNRRHEDRAREIGGYVAEGLQKMESGDLIQALPPFIQAMTLDSPEKQEMHRIRVGALLDQAPKLLQVWAENDEVRDGQFSPDGRLVALGVFGGQVHIKDALTGKEVAKPFGPKVNVTTVAFSPDGESVLVANQERTATLWDWRSGTNRLTFSDPQAATNAQFVSAQFSHKGDRIVTASTDHIARVWDARTGEVLHRLRGHTGAVLYAAFNSKDDLIVTGGRDNLAIIWQASDGERVGKPLLHASWVVHASFSPDGTRLATACLDHEAHIWDVETCREVTPGLRHRDGVNSVGFSADGMLLLTGCWERTAHLWLANSGRPFSPNPVLPHGERVLHTAFAPDGHRIITTCYDGTSRIWDIAGSIATPEFFCASLCETGARLLEATNSFLQVTDANSGKVYPRISASKPIIDAALNRNGRIVLAVVGESDLPGARSLYLWESDTGKQIRSIPGFLHKLENVRVSDDGRRLVAWERERLDYYDLGSKTVAQSPLVHSHGLTNVLFSPSANDLLTLSGKEAAVFDLTTLDRRFTRTHAVDLKGATWTPDGRFFITTCADPLFTHCVAQVWNALTGAPVGRPISHKDGVLDASFSATGRKVITASEDFTALITDLDGGRKPIQLRHTHQVKKACFSPSAAWVLTVGRDRLARLWEASTGEPITPPLPHLENLVGGAFVGNSAIATTGQKDSCWIWRFPPAAQSVDDLVSLAKLLNGDLSEPNAGLEPDAHSELLNRWQKLRDRYPNEFTVSKAEVTAWHEQQRARAKSEHNAEAAAFHAAQIHF